MSRYLTSINSNVCDIKHQHNSLFEPAKNYKKQLTIYPLPTPPHYFRRISTLLMENASSRPAPPLRKRFLRNKKYSDHSFLKAPDAVGQSSCRCTAEMISVIVVTVRLSPGYRLCGGGRNNSMDIVKQSY
ncbi:hypothetical protein HZH66_013673 [Vespula vulgaris]|uniref:Uncharacterized protein n=1 Tax=Vespula vulgaris TaxID=7454 RepID=A0A834J6X9_VESVU|nr:hypothetical protein HZH66_013673 [Vespula vulgaris]